MRYNITASDWPEARVMASQSDHVARVSAAASLPESNKVFLKQWTIYQLFRLSVCVQPLAERITNSDQNALFGRTDAILEENLFCCCNCSNNFFAGLAVLI